MPGSVRDWQTIQATFLLSRWIDDAGRVHYAASATRFDTHGPCKVCDSAPSWCEAIEKLVAHLPKDLRLPEVGK